MKDGAPYLVTSRFMTFVMADDDRCEESEWIKSFALERNLLALREHQYEGEEIGDMDRQMADMLAGTGYHEIKWLRKNVREIRSMPLAELMLRIDKLRNIGESDLVEQTLNLRRGYTAKPVKVLPSNTKIDKHAKLEKLRVMAERGEGGEAENARCEADKLARKLADAPSMDDLFDLDWDDLKVETVATPTEQLIKALDERLDWLEPMARIRYRFRQEAQQMHAQHTQKLIGILNDPHALKKRRLPEVLRRRQS